MAQGAVQAAQAELDVVTEARSKVVGELHRTQEARSEATTAAKAAEDAQRGAEAKLASALAAKSQKEAELELFRTYNVCMFKMLRDRSLHQQKVPVEQEITEGAGDQPAMDVSKIELAGVQDVNLFAPLAGA